MNVLDWLTLIGFKLNKNVETIPEEAMWTFAGEFQVD